MKLNITSYSLRHNKVQYKRNKYLMNVCKPEGGFIFDYVDKHEYFD